MIETSFLVTRWGLNAAETVWSSDETFIDESERWIVANYPANQGFRVYRLTRVDITQPGEDNGPVEA